MPAVFKLLLAGLLIWGVCFMGYYLFSGWSSEGEFAQKKAQQEKLIAEQQKAQQSQAAAGGHKEGKLADYIAYGKKNMQPAVPPAMALTPKGASARILPARSSSTAAPNRR